MRIVDIITQLGCITDKFPIDELKLQKNLALLSFNQNHPLDLNPKSRYRMRFFKNRKHEQPSFDDEMVNSAFGQASFTAKGLN